MSMPFERRDERGPWFEPWLFFAASLLLYAALGQRVFYKVDGPDLVYLLHEHAAHGKALQHPWHVGYLPLLDLFRQGLAALGLTPSLLRLGELFSALGMAIAVLSCRAGLRRLGVDAAEARGATLLFAASPGVLLFASVVELHAPAMAAVGLAFWWLCAAVQRPGWWRFLVLGMLTHAAFLLHGSHLLLPALLLPWFLALRWQAGTRKRDLLQAALALAVHAAAFLLLPRIGALQPFYGDYADLAGAFAREGSIRRPQSLDWMPQIFAQEWLLPLLPLSLLVWLAALRRELRLELLAFLLGLVPYLVLCTRQLVFEPERGAYLLPLLLPAARLSAAVLVSTRWLWPLVLLSLAGGFAQVWWHEAQLAPSYDEFAAGLDRAAGGRPALVLFGARRLPGSDAFHDELALVFATRDPAQALWVRTQAQEPRAQFAPAMAAGVVAWLRQKADAGTVVLLTEGGRAELEHPGSVLRAEKDTGQPGDEQYAGPLYFTALQQAFVLRPAASRSDADGGTRTSVWRLEPR